MGEGLEHDVVSKGIYAVKGSTAGEMHVEAHRLVLLLDLLGHLQSPNIVFFLHSVAFCENYLKVTVHSLQEVKNQCVCFLQIVADIHQAHNLLPYQILLCLLQIGRNKFSPLAYLSFGNPCRVPIARCIDKVSLRGGLKLAEKQLFGFSRLLADSGNWTLHQSIEKSAFTDITPAKKYELVGIIFMRNHHIQINKITHHMSAFVFYEFLGVSVNNLRV